VKLLQRQLIPQYIRFELGFPERHVCFRRSRRAAARVSMPKASVHEDGQSGGAENQVRATWEIARVEPESQSR
jgi:hypothetical protein